jgi:hypothetical protein
MKFPFKCASDVVVYFQFLTIVFHSSYTRDCYVAICGVPTPRADHAVAMARFATECLSKMNSLTKELEAILVRLY